MDTAFLVGTGVLLFCLLRLGKVYRAGGEEGCLAVDKVTYTLRTEMAINWSAGAGFYDCAKGSRFPDVADTPRTVGLIIGEIYPGNRKNLPTIHGKVLGVSP